MDVLAGIMLVFIATALLLLGVLAFKRRQQRKEFAAIQAARKQSERETFDKLQRELEGRKIERDLRRKVKDVTDKEFIDSLYVKSPRHNTVIQDVTKATPKKKKTESSSQARRYNEDSAMDDAINMMAGALVSQAIDSWSSSDSSSSSSSSDSSGSDWSGGGGDFSGGGASGDW